MVFILPKYIYENEPDSVWSLHWSLGEHELLDSITEKISHENYYLSYYSEYCIVVRNMKVLIGGQPEVVQTVHSFFTTTPPLHELISVSFIEKRTYHCGDTIYFDFNRKIDSLTTFLGNIVELGKICGETMLDSSRFINQTCPISADYWFNNDSTRIYALPTYTLSNDTIYTANINLSYITGDTLSDYYYQFQIPTYYKINLTAVHDTTDTLSPDFYFYPYKKGYTYSVVGDTITITAPQYSGNQKFIEWVCAEDFNIDTAFSNTITFVKDCHDIKDLNIFANYGDIPNDTLIIGECTGLIGGLPKCSISVYDKFDNYIGSSGTYYLLSEGDDYIKVIVEVHEECTFEWESNIYIYDGSLARELYIYANDFQGIRHINPNPIEEPQGFSLTISVRFPACYRFPEQTSFYSNYHQIRNIINVTPDPSSGTVYYHSMEKKWTYQNNPGQLPIIANIVHNDCGCYKISSIKGDIPDTYEHNFCTTYQDGEITHYGPHLSYIQRIADFNTGKRHKYVQIWVDRKLVELDAELIVLDGGVLSNDDDDARLEIIPQPSEDNANCYWPQYLINPERDDNKVNYKILYKCMTPVNINTHYNKDMYDFVKFNDVPPYYSNTSESEMDITVECSNFTLTTNKKIQAILDAGFRLMYIDICSDPENKSQFVRYKATTQGMAPFYELTAWEDPEKYVQISPEENTVQMKFIFSENVNKSTIDDMYNLVIKEIYYRIDRKIGPFNSNFQYYPTSFNSQWLDNKTLLLKCKTKINPGQPNEEIIKMLKMQDFYIYISPYIKSTNNDWIKNPNSYSARTELPEVEIELVEAKMTGSCGDGDAEVVMFYLMVYLDNKGNMEIRKDDVPNYNWNFIFRKNQIISVFDCNLINIWIPPWLPSLGDGVCQTFPLKSTSADIGYGVIFIDLDWGCVNDNRNTILDKAEDIFLYEGNPWSPKFYGGIGNLLYDAINGYLGCTITINQDDIMGQTHDCEPIYGNCIPVYLSHSNRWGTYNSNPGYKIFKNGIMEFKFKFTIIY